MTKTITDLPGVGEARALDLNKLGFRTLKDIANATPEALSAVPGFRAYRAQQIIAAAQAMLAEEAASAAKSRRRRTSTVATGSPAAKPARRSPSRSTQGVPQPTAQEPTSEIPVAASAAPPRRTAAPSPAVTQDQPQEQSGLAPEAGGKGKPSPAVVPEEPIPEIKPAKRKKGKKADRVAKVKKSPQISRDEKADKKAKKAKKPEKIKKV
mgnify:CR=1 FL=1